jgi:hypothetical protein
MLKQSLSPSSAPIVQYTCGWCNTHFKEWQSKCISCGGPMPPLPGMSLTEEPPPAPRTLPKGFETKEKWLGNAPAMVGGIFLLVGIIQFVVFILVLPLAAPFPLLFITIGWFIMRAGRKRAQQLINAFQNGRAVKGTITEVYHDGTIQVNGRHPWRINYSFQSAGGQTHEGFARTFDSSAQQRQPGQPIWVLVNDNNPEENTIYPPVK